MLILRNKYSLINILKTSSFIFKRNTNSHSAKYCLDLIKKHDYENFVCILLLKNTARSCAIAIRSFNVEVAKVREQTSDPKIALMRLQFWEETIDKCFTKDLRNVPHHPVAMQLFKSLTNLKLSKKYFMNLVSSRKEYIAQNSFSTLEELEKYSEKSVSPVYYLILEGLDVRSIHADHAASHLGKAQGIVQQLRIIPYARQLNTISLPQNILLKHSVSQEDILRKKPSECLKECVYEVSSRAHQHLMKARSFMEQVPEKGRAALLPAVPIYNYLDRLQKLDYEVLHPSLQQRSWLWLPRLWITHFRKKY